MFGGLRQAARVETQRRTTAVVTTKRTERFLKCTLRIQLSPALPGWVGGGMIHTHCKAPFMKVLQGFLDCQGVPIADVICSAEVVCVYMYLIMCGFLFVLECVCLCTYI